MPSNGQKKSAQRKQKMPTFQRIPETVDARPYTGGVQNGTDLCLWINSNGGKADWQPERVTWRSANREGVKWEHVQVYAMPYSHTCEAAYIGDWIVQRQTGKFEVMRSQDFEAEYVQV
jgi:hypothetical protein